MGGVNVVSTGSHKGSGKLGAVMAGQIAYTAGLFCTCAVLLPFGCAGWAIAVSAIYFAPLCAVAALYLTLAFAA